MSRISTPFRLPPLWRSLPLPCTSAAIALLLLVPALLLPRLPRPRAQGLEQLMDTATLLQSFPATPDRPVPALWQERLGPGLAPALWRQQRRTWWQFWGPHADGTPYLAISAAALPGGSSAALPTNGLRVGDLVVLAPDPLSRQLLADRLRPRLRPSRGLQRRCLALVESDQAVFWSPLALGVILGPVAPLFQPYQEGCLRLRLEAEGLSWNGEAAAVDGVLAPASEAPLDRPLPSQSPLPADLLLELEGPSLDPLLQGLLSRQLIREPLTSRYGLDGGRMALLRQAPFRLRLRPQPQGPFLASLDLQLGVGKDPRPWQQALTVVAKALQEQKLRPVGTSSPAPSGSTPDLSVWSREDGVVVGGWRWLPAAGGSPQLLLFLGPLPPQPTQPAATQKTPPVTPPLAPTVMSMRVRPDALDKLGLLPEAMPQLVRRATQLGIVAEPLPGSLGPSQPISRLLGRLQLPLNR